MATSDRDVLEIIRHAVDFAHESNKMPIQARNAVMMWVSSQIVKDKSDSRVITKYYFVRESPNRSHPYRARPADAGVDLPCSADVTVPPHEFADVPTNIAAQMPEGYWGLICSRSSAWFKKRLFIYQGKIDNEYRGELMFGVYNPTDSPIIIHKGERLAQFILVPQVDSLWSFSPTGLDATERGDQGFGSTGGMVSPFPNTEAPYGPDRDADGSPNRQRTRVETPLITEAKMEWDDPAPVAQVNPEWESDNPPNWPLSRPYHWRDATWFDALTGDITSMQNAPAELYIGNSRTVEPNGVAFMVEDLFPPVEQTPSARLWDWAMSTLEDDLNRTLPKTAEYGNGNEYDDLAMFGDIVNALTQGKLDAKDRKEAGVMLYIGGKVARAISSYAAGQVPSDDTWFDIFIYAMMGRKLRETGTWP